MLCLFRRAARARAPLCLAACLSLFGLGAGAAQADASIEMRGASADAIPQDYGYGRAVFSREAPLDLRRRTASMEARASRAPLPPSPAAPSPVAPSPVAPSPVGPSPEGTAAAAGRARPAWLEIERVGPPYEANGRWYTPMPEPGYEERGKAVRYPAGRRGGLTASGEPYDDGAITAAHPTLPTPGLVQVTNLQTGRELILRLTDRGPFGPGETLALSSAAADALGIGAAAQVHVRYLGPAPRRAMIDGASPPQSRAQASAPAPAGASVLVQVGVYSLEDNARRAERDLSAIGPVKIEPAFSEGRALYRVRLGPWASAEAAEAARARAIALGFTGARLVRG